MDSDRERISYIVGQRIYTFRTQKKLSQEALAFESEIHPAYLGRVERGEKCPTIETLYKISKGLKIPLHEPARCFYRSKADEYRSFSQNPNSDAVSF